MENANEPTDEAARAWLAAFVTWESVPTTLDAWVDRVEAAVLSQSPQVAGDAGLALSVRATIRSHWMSFLATLKDPAYEVPLVQSAAELAAELADRGMELTVLLHMYRVAQQEVWRYVTGVVTSAPEEQEFDRTAMLIFLWGRITNWLDSSVVASTEVYRAEYDRNRNGAAARQLDTVREILGGRDPEPREVSAALGGYVSTGYNTAVLLHTEEYRELAGLQSAVTQLAQALKARHPLVVSPGGRDLWCWFGTRSRPDVEQLRACEDWLAERRISVTVGTPVQGLDGFRLSHDEAQQSARVLIRARRRRAVTLFRDVELFCLVADSQVAARRFVRRTLGELAQPGEGKARLRETLHALLATGSVDEAATQLMVHKNTVRYRTAQAEALLGYPVSSARSEIELALRYHAMFLED